MEHASSWILSWESLGLSEEEMLQTKLLKSEDQQRKIAGELEK